MEKIAILGQPPRHAQEGYKLEYCQVPDLKIRTKPMNSDKKDCFGVLEMVFLIHISKESLLENYTHITEVVHDNGVSH